MTNDTAISRRRLRQTATAAGPALPHAGIALVIGAVFSLFLRNNAIAALLEGSGYALVTVLVVVVAAIGFGALGRIFTAKKSGWVLALTVLAWAPAVGATAFFSFASDGIFRQLNPLTALVGGVVAGASALIAHRGVWRVVGIVLVIGVVAGLVINLFTTGD
jgi:hypothetical protein